MTGLRYSLLRIIYYKYEDSRRIRKDLLVLVELLRLRRSYVSFQLVIISLQYQITISQTQRYLRLRRLAYTVNYVATSSKAYYLGSALRSFYYSAAGATTIERRELVGVLINTICLDSTLILITVTNLIRIVLLYSVYELIRVADKGLEVDRVTLRLLQPLFKLVRIVINQLAIVVIRIVIVLEQIVVIRLALSITYYLIVEYIRKVRQLQKG